MIVKVYRLMNSKLHILFLIFVCFYTSVMLSMDSPDRVLSAQDFSTALYGDIDESLDTENQNVRQRVAAIPFNLNSTPERTALDIMKKKTIKTPDVTELERCFNDMECLPGDSKVKFASDFSLSAKDRLKSLPQTDSRAARLTGYSAGASAAGASRSLLSPDAQENNDWIKSLRDTAGNKGKEKLAKVVAISAEQGGTSLRRKMEGIDLGHSKTPEIKRDGAGTIKQVLGGHDFNAYMNGQLGTSCFISPDNNTIGVYVEDVVPKTVSIGFDEDFIINIVRKSQELGRQDELEIRQDDTGYYFGLFKSARNALIVTSVFPIIVIKDTGRGQISLGNFGTIDSVDNKLTIDTTVTVSRDIFYSMIDGGTMLQPNSKSAYQLIDITQPVMTYLQSDLDSRGLTKFFPIFALIPKN